MVSPVLAKDDKKIKIKNEEKRLMSELTGFGCLYFLTRELRLLKKCPVTEVQMVDCIAS